MGGLQRSLVREWWPDSEGPVRLFGSGQISGFLGVILEIGGFEGEAGSKNDPRSGAIG